MASPVLTVEELCVGFPTRSARIAMAADEVTLHLEAGQTLGLVGESGCGKSVTLRAIIGLVQYPGQVLGGSVRLEGREILELPEREAEKVRGADIAMIFQDPSSALNPLFRIGDQMTESLRIKSGVGRKEARREAVDLLERVGIPAADTRVDDYPHQLSGGMRQRVMIAMAIATKPKILLADEPTTSLDVTTQDQILQLIAAIAGDLDMGTILVSHDLAVIADVCDDVAVMYGGRVVERGPTREVLENPRHPYTEGLARAVAELGGLRGASLNRRLQTLPGQPPALTELPTGCSFAPRCRYRRPECGRFDMHLDAQPPAHGTACLVRQEEAAL